MAIENIASACTESVDMYVSSSDMITPVTHYSVGDGGTDQAVLWLYWYF